LEDLLISKDLDSICVSEIVKKSGVCRKTFYRHFQDKFDLADYYFSQFFEETFGQITSGEDWESALLCYLEICAQKADILCHAYSSMDINGLKNYDIQITRKTYEKYLLAQGADINTPEMRFAIEIASRGSTEMVINWLINGMNEDKVQLMMLIKRTLPMDIAAYL
jgi:AcrR family transcriptional regulator